LVGGKVLVSVVWPCRSCLRGSPLKGRKNETKASSGKEWFAVRSVSLFAVAQNSENPATYEERITIWRVRNSAVAVRKAQSELAIYLGDEAAAKHVWPFLKFSNFSVPQGMGQRFSPSSVTAIFLQAITWKRFSTGAPSVRGRFVNKCPDSSTLHYGCNYREGSRCGI
jgi:hypothetical protein